jgi:hypothetical protein
VGKEGELASKLRVKDSRDSLLKPGAIETLKLRFAMSRSPLLSLEKVIRLVDSTKLKLEVKRPLSQETITN